VTASEALDALANECAAEIATFLTAASDTVVK
jgi:hypothetical protein